MQQGGANPSGGGRVLELQRKRANANAQSTKGKKTKMQRKHGKQHANTAKEPVGILQGRRVLVVPIGADVSRKRVEIWHEMVQKLAGVNLAAATASSDQQRRCHNNRHLNSDSKKAAPPLVDWGKVDIVIASAQLDQEKAKDHYCCGAFPPKAEAARIKVYTPEWLIFLMRERKLPTHDDAFEWAQVKQQVEAENYKQQQELEDETKAAADAEEGKDESLVEDEGSDIRNRSNQEIVRAPPVVLDLEKLQREEDELQKQKDQLVKERTPIFFANNPGFEVIADGLGGKPMKAEVFVCQKSSMMQSNLNAHLTDPLEELMEYLHVEHDIWREYMYKKVVTNLKAARTRVSSVRDLRNFPWAKGRVRDKIAEVLETGKIEKLEAKKLNPRLKCLVQMARIWGVGPATAAKLYNMGFKTLDDLCKNGDSVLTDQQKIGLKHYEDFLTKIPRAEVAQIEKTVVDEVRRLIPNATALSCGSYRRGNLSSGDCDVLITDPNNEECAILPDDLTHITENHMGGCDTYMGVCRVSKDLPHRRLDIKVYPRRCFGFAILYFTGSDHFNRSMRLFANKKGWILSDRALKPVTRVNGKKMVKSETVICTSEVDVFIALGMEYKDPQERNCFDIRFVDEDEANTRKKGGGQKAAQSAEEVGGSGGNF